MVGAMATLGRAPVAGHRMLDATLAGITAFVVSFALLYAALALHARLTEPTPDKAGFAIIIYFAAMLYAGWIPPLILGIATFFVIALQGDGGGHLNWPTIAGVAIPTALVTTALISPVRTEIAGRFALWWRDRQTARLLYDCAPGELGRALGRSSRGAVREIWLRATARDRRVIARYADANDAAAAADRAAATAFALKCLESPPCSGDAPDTSNGLWSPNITIRRDCRSYAMETLMLVSMREPVDDRVEWLLARAPSADLLWYLQSTLQAGRHLPTLDALNATERRTLDDAARRRLRDTPVPGSHLRAGDAIRAIALDDARAASVLAAKYLG